MISPPSQPNPTRRSRTPLALGLLVFALLASWGLFRFGSGHPAVNPGDTAEAQGPNPSAANPALTPASIQPVSQAAVQTGQLGEWASQLADSKLAPKARRQAARELARIGSDDSLAILKHVLPDAPAYLKTAIGEALGQSLSPQARGLLLELVDGQDEAAARGAARGLAKRGDAEAADVLANLMFNPQKSQGVRTEAAQALGEVEQPAALSALARAAREFTDPELVNNALEALGQKPLAQTESFFRDYLSTPNLSPETKVAALEALGTSAGDVSSLVTQFLDDPNAEVRAAAAWALSTTENGALGEPLTSRLTQETSPEVRARLYEALAGQTSVDRATVLPLVERETDAAARLAGLTLMGDWVRTEPTADVLAYFNQTAVPELKGDALNDPNGSTRLASVFALRRAGTPEAGQALQDIAASSSDPRVVSAARAAQQARKP